MLWRSWVAHSMDTESLKVDHRPALHSVMEFAEYLQAEELALTTGGASSLRRATRRLHLRERRQSRLQPWAPKRGWGSRQKESRAEAEGCRRGDGCSFSHDWEGTAKEGRCFGCSDEGHMKKDCPHRGSVHKEKKDPPQKTQRMYKR